MADHPNLALVRRYYDACNRGDEATLRDCFTDDVVHYFTGRGPAAGAEKLVAYCLASVAQVGAYWTIDHALAGDDEVVIEWTMRWRPRGHDEPILTRGTEWIVMRAGRIAEVRAYFQRDAEDHSTGLQGFSYPERGYTV